MVKAKLGNRINKIVIILLIQKIGYPKGREYIPSDFNSLVSYRYNNNNNAHAYPLTNNPFTFTLQNLNLLY